MDKKASDAENRYKSDPTLENLIWYGRRIGYTGDFEKSIRIYTMGLENFGTSPRLLRHRGHRYISNKEFDNAITDLKQAETLIQGKEDHIEEDGMPNSKNIPLSTLHFNIYYHLGLAYYLAGNFEESYHAYSSCLEVSNNDDSVVACSYWLYLISRQLDDKTLFSPPKQLEHMEIIENTAYHNLLKLYLGKISKDDLEMNTDIDTATIRYGLAMYHFFSGNVDHAKSMLRDNIEHNHPAAFGTIVSEVEYKRLD